jgi:hypothetical protein
VPKNSSAKFRFSRAVCSIPFFARPQPCLLASNIYNATVFHFLFMETPILEVVNAMAVLGKVNKLPSLYRIVFTKNHIYLLHKGGTGFMAIVAMQFGLLGWLIDRFVTKRVERKFFAQLSTKSPDDLVQENAKSLKLSYPEIEKFEIKGRLHNYRGMRAINLLFSDKKYALYFPKDIFEQVERLFYEKCQGRAVT